ncbi:putative proton pump-interactor [Helianthus annuus]|nr:putative proton pump-interactor [Helianthus annuus]
MPSSVMANHNHKFYIVKIRPCREEHEKEEADKQYQSMNLARFSINEDIANLKLNERQINQKIMKFSHLDKQLKWKIQEIKDLEQCELGMKHYLPFMLEPRTTGFFQLPEKDARTMIRQGCQKRLIKNGRMDMEHLQQVEEQLLCSKKSIGITSCGTQELNDMIKSMVQSIQHGNKKWANEIKIQQEIGKFMETVDNAPEPEPYDDCRWKRMVRFERIWKRNKEHSIKIRLEELEQIKRKIIGRKAKVKRLKAELEHVRKNISSLEKEIENVNTKRSEAYKRGYELGEQKKDLSSSYTKYQSLMRHAKELAHKGDVVGLKQACDTQVEEFTTQWNDSKAFREDYEKRKLVRSG